MREKGKKKKKKKKDKNKKEKKCPITKYSMKYFIFLNVKKIFFMLSKDYFSQQLENYLKLSIL